MQTPTTCNILFHQKVKMSAFEITNNFYTSRLLRKTIPEFQRERRDRGRRERKVIYS